jgi:hypothetical protein
MILGIFIYATLLCHGHYGHLVLVMELSRYMGRELQNVTNSNMKIYNCKSYKIMLKAIAL